MRHQTFFVGDCAHQFGVYFNRIQGGKPQPAYLGNEPQQLSHKRTKARPAREIQAVSCQINARKNDFGIPTLCETACFLHDGAHRYASRIPPPKRNDAECAAVIAAVLNLQKSAGATLKTVYELGSGFPDRKDIVDPYAFRCADAEICVAGEPEFLVVSQHKVDFRHIGEALGLGLRCATGDDDFGIGICASVFAHRLFRLSHGLARHRTGVDDDCVAKAGLRSACPNNLRFIGIETATEGDDFERGHPRASSAATSISPANTKFVPPVISTWSSSVRHSIDSVPPSRMTSQLRGTRRLRALATSDAQAPVPHARVSPTPRSQTRILNFAGPATLTNSTFACSGNSACRSRRAPIPDTGAASASETKTTQCGLPTETAAVSSSTPSI